MANTFYQIQMHIVFAVRYRDAVLSDNWREELFRYIGGIIKQNGCIPVIVGGWRDHIHILLGCGLKYDLPALVKNIKLATNQWLQPKFRCRFSWQDGYAAFSVSKTHEASLINYIAHQAEHHSTVSMRDEFKRLLTVNGINYDTKYIPHDPE